MAPGSRASDKDINVLPCRFLLSRIIHQRRPVKQHNDFSFPDTLRSPEWHRQSFVFMWGKWGRRARTTRRRSSQLLAEHDSRPEQLKSKLCEQVYSESVCRAVRSREETNAHRFFSGREKIHATAHTFTTHMHEVTKSTSILFLAVKESDIVALV